MFKRLSLICALGISLVVLWGTDANALRLGGWGFNIGSVEATTLWTGVGNYTLKPSDVAITLDNVQLKLYSINPGGNTGGDGVPFSLTDNIRSTDAADNVSKNGKYESTIIFEDKEFIDLIDYVQLESLLPNPNWELDPTHVDVLQFDAIVQGFSDVSDRCDLYYMTSGQDVLTSCYPFSESDPNQLGRYEEEVAHLEVRCYLVNGAYACTVLQEWGYSKPDPIFVPK